MYNHNTDIPITLVLYTQRENSFCIVFLCWYSMLSAALMSSSQDHLVYETTQHKKGVHPDLLVQSLVNNFQELPSE